MKRLNFLDYLRGIAIILMFITHSFRLQVPHLENGSWKDGLNIFLEFFMFIEPLTPALFLFIAGYSLQMSYHKDPTIRAWGFIKKYRSLVAWSFIIALAAEGFFPERFFLSSGILQSIATGLLISSFLLGKSFESKALIFLTILFTGAGFCFDYFQVAQAPLNAGLGVWFPQLGFIFAGSLYFLKKDKAQGPFSDLVLIGIIILYTSNLPWVNVISTTSGGWSLKELSYHTKEFKNWNHTGWGFLATLGITYLLFNWLAHAKFKLPLARFISALGTKALTLYVFHLSVISLCWALGINFTSPLQSAGFILGLLITSYGITKTKLLI